MLPQRPGLPRTKKEVSHPIAKVGLRLVDGRSALCMAIDLVLSVNIWRMSAFDLESSWQRAQTRLKQGSRGAGSRRQRSDRGVSRLDLRVLSRLRELLHGHDRPPMRQITKQLQSFCSREGLRMPSRATLYETMNRLECPDYEVAQLPEEARASLYNLSAEGKVPGHQLVFHCLNYGGLKAASFAAGLPWLALYQAARLPGWRPRSRGLLTAICRVRGV